MGGSAYLLHKKAFHALALSFDIFDLCETRIEYGGVVRPETLRTAPHRRIVMVVAFKKKRWENQKKCALTVKQVSVTTWSLTSGDFFF